MKKRMSFLISALLLLFLVPVIAVSADAATSGDFEYDTDDGQAMVLAYIGDGGSVTVPATLGGCPVTEIAAEAFLDCTSVTKVTLPQSIIHIGESAFSGCSNLVTVNLPDSLYELGARAFFRCVKLQSITIPDHLTEISERVFWGCESLKSADLGTGVTSVGEAAFCGCSSMTSVTMGSRITTLEKDAFSFCEALASVTLPKTLKTIGDGAFSGCESLTSIKIPAGVTYLGADAFSCCHGLTSFVIPEGITAVSDNLLDGCWNLKSVTIPDSVTSIGKFAFCENVKLTSITIPQGVTSIGRGAFSWCEGLTTVILPKGLTTLADDLFFRASGLQSVHIPGSVTAIGSMAFYECTALTDVYYNGSKASAGKITFGADNSYLENADWHYTVAITTQPKSVTVEEGKPAKVTVKATGDGLTYRWYYKNAGASEYTYTASFKGSNYSVTMNEARDGRRVLCKITDKYGNTVQSASALLSMKKQTTPLTITRQPQSVTVPKGELAKITVEATGDGLSYKWYYKNPGASTYTYTATFKGRTYSTTMNESRDGRRVLCKVYDKYGNMVQTQSALMKMAPALTITEEPRDVTVAFNEMAKVTVRATGEGLTYQWFYRNSGASTFSYTASFTGNTYSISMNPDRNGRQVYCKITDQYGQSVTSETVTLRMDGTPVQIVTQPQSVTVAEGETATVTVEATGIITNYRWYYKDSGSDKYVYTPSFTRNTYCVEMNAERSGRRVLCKIYDIYGNMVQSSSALLSMK